MQQNTNEIQARLDESNRTLNDYDAAKKKLVVENADLLRQLEEAESQIGQLTKMKLSLTNQLDDTRKLADDESRVSKAYVFPKDTKNTRNIFNWFRMYLRQIY